jgi:hypothetical protein
MSLEEEGGLNLDPQRGEWPCKKEAEGRGCSHKPRNAKDCWKLPEVRLEIKN